MSVQSLIHAIAKLDDLRSASALAADHDVNLKTAIAHLTKAGFVWDTSSWVRLQGEPDKQIDKATEPAVRPALDLQSTIPKSFHGLVLLIPQDLVARAKEIEKYRRDTGVSSTLAELQQDHGLDDAMTQNLALNWLLDQVDKLKLSWLEHNVLTAKGFQPISRKLPPLPEVPKNPAPVEPYERHEPDDAEPHEPGYRKSDYESY